MATDLLPLTDGGVLVLRPDTDLEDLFSIIDAERHWRCAVFGDELIWVPPANPWSSSLASELGLPDLALEVRSPGDAPLVWDKKLSTYLGISGGTLWAIDPQERGVLVYVDGYPGPEQGAIHERDAVPRVPDVLTGGVPLTVSLVEIWSLA